jgi:hypothetical protein
MLNIAPAGVPTRVHTDSLSFGAVLVTERAGISQELDAETVVACDAQRIH